MKRGHSLFKYFSERRWADAFLDGQVMFRSLAYFRDHEEQDVRGDANEGSAIFRPEGGLVVTNQTQGKTFPLPGHAFVSRARQGEIFVFCTSRSLNDDLRKEFKAVVCVEILDVSAFCARVQAALPVGASFPGRPGHTRIGNRVEYYETVSDITPRWAVPGRIATSKLAAYARQHEFRLVFSLTDALGFEKVDLRLEPAGPTPPPNHAEHHDYPVTAQPLGDICKLREF